MRLKPGSVAGIGRKIRLAAGHVMVRLGPVRRREIRRLFDRTAVAFGCPLPPLQARSVKGLLSEYARFTREQAEAALDNGQDLQALTCRLFKAAYALGRGYRLRLRVRDIREAMAAARLIYHGLGIDFKGGPDGEVTICRCAFAKAYTSRVCALVSALDRGLIAGLTAGGELIFRQRITEGATACRAQVTGGWK